MNRRKWLYLAISVLCGLVLLVGACAKPAPAPTPTAPAAPAAPAVKPITLKIHMWGPPRDFCLGVEYLAEEVTDRTGGAIEFEMFYSNALGKTAEQIDNIKAGTFDIGPFAPGYGVGKTPVWNVLNIPMLTHDPAAMAKAAAAAAALPVLEAELKAWNGKFLFAMPISSSEYIGNEPVRVLEDWKGLRVRGSGGFETMLSAFGAVPVGLSLTETYEALERGTIDGVTSVGIETAAGYRLHEISKYFCIYKGGALTFPAAINLNAWNKLSPEFQEIMMEVSAEIPDEYGKLYETVAAKWRPEFEKLGIEIIAIAPDEVAKMQEVGRTAAIDAYLKDMEERGFGQEAQKALSTVLEATQKYTK